MICFISQVLGEYNKSVICFENTQRIQPDFEAAAKRKFAVLCHSKLESALEAQHKLVLQIFHLAVTFSKSNSFISGVCDSTCLFNMNINLVSLYLSILYILLQIMN